MRRVYKPETNCFRIEIAAIPAGPTLPPIAIHAREKHMKRIFRLAWDAFAAARLKRARARMIEQLDERTLRDVGFEFEANRARERSRVALRFGAY